MFSKTVLALYMGDTADAPDVLVLAPTTPPATDLANREPSSTHCELSIRHCSPDTPGDRLKKKLTEKVSKRSRALLK